MKTVLTIAGSDCSGGAGIQADLKTIGAFGLYGMSVVTAITVQNTIGVRRVEPLSGALVEEQLCAVLEDIFPDAVKIGMLVTPENIEAVAGALEEYQEKRGRVPIVLDPVLVSTSGKPLLAKEAKEVLAERLFPLSDLITPNRPEAEVLSEKRIRSREGCRQAAQELQRRYHCSVLIKGGHAEDGADDFLWQGPSGGGMWFCARRSPNPNTHGTGCTLSSAIACGLAEGKSRADSVRAAKKYISGAIDDGMDLGSGRGPLNHFWKGDTVWPSI